MMKTYKHSEHVIRATSAADVVRQMRAGAYDPTDSEANYMKEVAARAEVQTGKVVRHDTFENFVGDLVSAGLLEEIAQ